MRTWGIRATPKVINTRGSGMMNTISPGRRMPAVAPVAAAASTVTSKFNRKASRRADNLTNRVDNNKAGRVKAKERKAKARLHLRND